MFADRKVRRSTHWAGRGGCLDSRVQQSAMLVGLQMLMLQRGRTDGTLREHKHGVARERLGGLESFFDVWAAHRVHGCSCSVAEL